jgi:hypothetical protein
LRSAGRQFESDRGPPLFAQSVKQERFCTFGCQRIESRTDDRPDGATTDGEGGGQMSREEVELFFD